MASWAVRNRSARSSTGHQGAGGELVAPRSKDGEPIERRGSFGEPGRAGEVLLDRLLLVRGERLGWRRRSRLVSESGRTRPRGPCLPIRPAGGWPSTSRSFGRRVSKVAIWAARAEVSPGPPWRLRSRLGGSRTAVTTSIGDAGELGGAVVYGPPLDAEPFGEQVAEVCFVQVAGRLGVGEDVAEVERAPSAVRAPHGVGDEDVRVQVRIAGAARAMPEGGADQAVAGTSSTPLRPRRDQTARARGSRARRRRPPRGRHAPPRRCHAHRVRTTRTRTSGSRTLGRTRVPDDWRHNPTVSPFSGHGRPARRPGRRRRPRRAKPSSSAPRPTQRPGTSPPR